MNRDHADQTKDIAENSLGVKVHKPSLSWMWNSDAHLNISGIAGTAPKIFFLLMTT
jgi:hypothetical protein